MKALAPLLRMNGWVALLTAAIALVGCAFIRSATLDEPDFAVLASKHVMVLLLAAASGLALVLVPYPRLLRRAGLLYAAAFVGLVLLPFLGVVVNGARRWYRLPGFYVQPSEVAKLAVIIALAAYLRFRRAGRAGDALLVPLLITTVPAVLVARQPDLGSALVFVPVMLAMCYAAGVSGRKLLALVAILAAALVASYLVMHDYQRARIHTWFDHFSWVEGDVDGEEEMTRALRGYGYQPWQALIAIGSGGMFGFGLEQGPQNRYGFLPYRFDDYIFAVVAEETGLAGACGLIALQGLLVAGLLSIALRTRERFGRLIAVGVAAYFATQTLVHVAVCVWLIPSTGLPLPLVSYGGSSAVVSVWAVCLALNVSAHRQPVLAADGFA